MIGGSFFFGCGWGAGAAGAMATGALGAGEQPATAAIRNSDKRSSFITVILTLQKPVKNVRTTLS
jgi:hypothetical protein